jgi:predicted metalloendopeptidase
VRIGRSNYLENQQAATAFEFERWVRKIGTAVDRTEWQMTPPTVNAYEDPRQGAAFSPNQVLRRALILFDPRRKVPAACPRASDTTGNTAT